MKRQDESEGTSVHINSERYEAMATENGRQLSLENKYLPPVHFCSEKKNKALRAQK